MCRKLYSGARADALKELYKSKELDRDRPESIEADFEEVAASCGHFSFSLQTFAEEMQTFLSVLEDLKETTEKDNARSWNWIRFWRKSKPQVTEGPNAVPEEQERLIQQPQEAMLPKDLPDLVLDRRETRQWKATAENKKWDLYRKILNVVMFISRDDGMYRLRMPKQPLLTNP